MKTEVLKCDIEDLEHSGLIVSIPVPVIFDHDQEDGKSKTDPYWEKLTLELCRSCRDYIFNNRRMIYAYGAMGYNNYYLKERK